MISTERIRDALRFIHVGGHDERVRVAFMLKSELGESGRDLWDEWRGDRGDDEAESVWKSASETGPLKIGTLFHEAKANGWRDDGTHPKPTPEDLAEKKRRRAESDAQSEAEERAKHEAAMLRAAEILEAATGDPATHPYPLTLKKGINLGPRVKRGKWPQRGWNDALLAPIYQPDGKTCSIEAINVDGQKDSLKDGKKAGGFHHFGKITGAKRVLIGEGLATVAAAVDADGSPAAAALTRNNLKAVGKMARKLAAPDAEIIILADHDPKPDGTNPGLHAAKEAAAVCSGSVAVFGTYSTPCDCWDIWANDGKEAVKSILGAARKVGADNTAKDKEPPPAADPDGWPEPQPLAVKVEPEPYPLDALPDTIRAAVTEVQAFTKAPIAMVASSALAALSLPIQAYVDIKRADRLTGPVGLFVLIFGDSGERKSTCDGFFSSAIHDYQAEQAELAKPEQETFRAKLSAWEAKRTGMLDAIKLASKGGKPTANIERELHLHEQDKPKPPRVPKLLRGDDTPENLAFVLANNYPSAGVISAEGGIIFGSHGMGSESAMRNLALLNILWDGSSLDIGRRSKESFTVRGARLTIGIQVQEAVIQEFCAKSGALARGTGFFARFLMANPVSTQGFRPFTEAPENWPHLAEFNRRIAAILNQPAPMDDSGALTPAMMTLSPKAKSAWIEYHDAIESELASGGELYDVRDVASKSADNAVRLSALFQVFEHGTGGPVGLDCFEGASRIAAWHLHESRRFFGELALPAELADAARLDTWLIEYCSRKSTLSVGKNYVRQHGPLRDGKRLDAAIRELAAFDRLKLESIGKHLTIFLNPALVA